MEWRLREVSVWDFIPETELRQTLQRLFDNAQPMWNHDPYLLRQAKTQRLTLVGSNAAHLVRSTLNEIRPAAILVNTEDPYRLIVMSVHRGVPLFALRRLGEYRTHYAEMLRHSKLPAHSARDLALADDPFPVCPPEQPAAASLFAAGLALRIVQRDPDGRYLAPQDRTRMVRLSADKVRAAALIGMNGQICREIGRQLDLLIATRGPAAIQSALEGYMATTPGIEDWEVKGILEWEQMYPCTPARER